MMTKLSADGFIREPEPKQPGFAFFNLAFRPMFLLGSVFSVVSILLWVFSFNGYFVFEPYGGSYWWHMHEMLFGFVAAIMAGFLLTAVQTWTQVPSIKGKPLMALVLLWLAGRVLMLFPDIASPVINAIVDSLFLPAAIIALAIPILKVRQWRNLVFVPVLTLMAIANIVMHVQAQAAGAIQQVAYFTVLLITLVMCILGGRVFPMFTANGTQTQRVPSIAWLELFSIVSVLVCVLLATGWIPVGETITAVVFIVAGGANFIRAFRWRIWVTFGTPLVWPLHISYWALSIGLVLVGLAQVVDIITMSQAIHTITVGAMGLMILAMISRVSLGHTGRNIAVGAVLNFAFILLVLSLLVRVLMPSLLSSHYILLMLVAGVMWAVAYTLFVIKYTAILSKPRIDGRPG